MRRALELSSGSASATLARSAEESRLSTTDRAFSISSVPNIPSTTQNPHSR